MSDNFIEIKGLNEAKDKINKMETAMKSVEGQHTSEIGDIFNDGFMHRYTNYNNVEDFFKDNDISVEEVQNYDDNADKLDKIAQEKANFETFGDFIGKGILDHSLEQQGLSLD